MALQPTKEVVEQARESAKLRKERWRLRDKQLNVKAKGTRRSQRDTSVPERDGHGVTTAFVPPFGTQESRECPTYPDPDPDPDPVPDPAPGPSVFHGGVKKRRRAIGSHDGKEAEKPTASKPEINSAPFQCICDKLIYQSTDGRRWNEDGTEHRHVSAAGGVR